MGQDGRASDCGTGRMTHQRTWQPNEERLVVMDRLGSRRNPAGMGEDYYPYGEERYGLAGDDREKFATYWRDGFTGFDYARQRYYVPRSGRFLTPDPYRASAALTNPQTWNRYAYVAGDPVNFVDPWGLFLAAPEEVEGGPGPMQMIVPLSWFAGGGGGGGYGPGEPPPGYGPAGGGNARVVRPRSILRERLRDFADTNCGKLFAETLNIDLTRYVAGQNTPLYDLRNPNYGDTLVRDIVGDGGSDANRSLRDVVGTGDAAVVHGSRGAAILLGPEFYGVNLQRLDTDEWQQHKRRRGSILLHELLHVYDRALTDQYILAKWAAHMFAGGTAPKWGGTRWISIWIDNDCKPIDASRPGVFW